MNATTPDLAGQPAKTTQARRREAATALPPAPAAAPPSAASALPPALYYGGQQGEPPEVNPDTASPALAAIGVDTIRMVLPVGERDAVMVLLADLLGPADPMPRGRWSYRRGWSYGCGAEVFADDGDDTRRPHAGLCVEFKGETITRLGQVGTWELVADLARRGGKCRRFDARADFRGRPLLIDRMINACSAGKLCGARRWQPWPLWENGKQIGHGLTLGKRGGDGSGRYVRAYDKGLETGTAEKGRWERVEVEFAKLAAEMVCDDWIERGDDYLMEHDGDIAGLAGHLAAYLARRIFGAFDFRDGDKQSPRVGWWSSFLGGLAAIPTIVRRQASTLDGLRGHLARTIKPTIKAIMKATGDSALKVIQRLGLLDLKDVKPVRLSRPTVAEYAAERRQLGKLGHQQKRLGLPDRWETWLNRLRASNIPDSLFPRGSRPTPVMVGTRLAGLYRQ